MEEMKEILTQSVTTFSFQTVMCHNGSCLVMLHPDKERWEGKWDKDDHLAQKGQVSLQQIGEKKIYKVTHSAVISHGVDGRSTD